MTILSNEQLKQIENDIRAKIAASSEDEDILYLVEDLGADTPVEFLAHSQTEGIDISVISDDLEHIDTDCVRGDGSEAYTVFKHKPTGALVGFTGWYASHEGYNWEDAELTNMAPYQVTHYGKAD